LAFNIFLISLHLEKLTQKFSLFLELHRMFNEVNKYQHYSHFKKRKTKFISGCLPFLAPVRPSRTARSHSPASRARVAQQCGPAAPAPTLSPALSPSLADLPAPPVIPFLRSLLLSRDPAMPARWPAGDHGISRPTKLLNGIYTSPRIHFNT
jgi:hypothetical protein